MSQKRRKYTEKSPAEVDEDEVPGSFLRKMAALLADDEEFTMETRMASPAHLLLKIESFSLLSEQGVQKHESREFEAGDYKWRLEIHSDGLTKSEDGDNHVSVYLTIVNCTNSVPQDLEVNAFFNVFLYNHILDSYLCFRSKTQRFHALMKTKRGFSKLMSKQSLLDPSNGFLVDDTCVFGAEVFVIKTQRVTESVSLREIGNPYKRDWKIPRFSKLGRVWTSENFTARDHKWRVKLYPNGNSGQEGASVSMYLELVGAKSFASHEKVKAHYHLRIKNQLNDQYHSKNLTHWYTSSSSDWGWPAFIPLSNMHDSKKGFIVNDCCFVEVEISVEAVVRFTCGESAVCCAKLIDLLP